MMNISPEKVLSLKKPTGDFLCSQAGYRLIQFLEFTIKNEDTKELLFQLKRPDVPIQWDDIDVADEGRSVAYTFPANFLSAKSIASTLVFAVGPKELKNFRMIERHYFRDRLLKSFDFDFGFCIPNTVNSWEHIYEVPQLDEKTKNEMILSPGQTVSDSFYFIDGKLVLHNKATYSYSSQK
ncbi:putative UNC119 [Entophlyctis helioformis]|nr:putative UNC119 [Entophlyctis helioformis]